METLLFSLKSIYEVLVIWLSKYHLDLSNFGLHILKFSPEIFLSDFMVAQHLCGPTRLLQIQGHPDPHCEFQARQSYNSVALSWKDEGRDEDEQAWQ